MVQRTAPLRATTLPVLDRDDLLQRAGGDHGLAAELLEIFASAILPEAWRLASGAVDGNARSAAAHRLRGAALAIGAGEVAMIAGVIEAAPGDPLPEGFAAALARLEAAIRDADGRGTAS